jgi:hypothetical protein
MTMGASHRNLNSSVIAPSMPLFESMPLVELFLPGSVVEIRKGWGSIAPIAT